MTNTETMSHAELHKLASRELLRQEMNAAIAKIWDATHVVESKNGAVYAFGAKRAMIAYARDFRGAKVRPMTDEEKILEANHKRKVYGNP